jgi:hypothetical protein
MCSSADPRVDAGYSSAVVPEVLPCVRKSVLDVALNLGLFGVLGIQWSEAPAAVWSSFRLTKGWKALDRKSTIGR